MPKDYWYKETEFINSKFNILYEDLLYKTEEDMTKWLDDLREYMADLLQNKEFQPSRTYEEKEIIKQFGNLNKEDVSNKFDFIKIDELDGEENVLWNYKKFCPATKQFFPNMVKVNYSGTHSLTDYCTKEKLKPSFHNRLWGNFRFDSFYTLNGYACKAIGAGIDKDLTADTGVEWIEAYATSTRNTTIGFWIFANYNKKRRKDYFGRTVLTITKDELDYLKDKGLITEGRHLTNIRGIYSQTKKHQTPVYEIRTFEYGNKIFPAFYDAFKTGLGQNPTVFAELRAKYLLYKATEHIIDEKLNNGERIIYYDSSAGWGNRLLASLSQKEKFHYVGTDPNMDNMIPELEISRYEYIANFYNKHIRKSDKYMGDQYKNTCHMFQDPAEDIHENKDFQQYKGKIDIVFTSPPYFNKEQYSNDEGQSWKRYGAGYTLWREGFLKPSLKTAVEYLKTDRYILYNIADVRDGKTLLPLEEDSIKFLESQGMMYQGKLKMSLGKLPGQSSITKSSDMRNFKNTCKVDGKEFKYEPILIFYKPDPNLPIRELYETNKSKKRGGRVVKNNKSFIELHG